MSTTHIQPLPNVRGRMSYTELGEGKKRTRNIREKTNRIAAQMGDMGTREDFIRFCSAMRRQSQGTRLNEGYELRVSWSPEELSRDSPEDIQRACEYGYALCKEVAPNAPCWVTVHTDGEGGCVHVHATIANHDLVSGTAIAHGTDHATVKRKNDRLSREMGFTVVGPEPAREPTTWAERKGQFGIESFERVLGNRVADARDHAGNMEEFLEELKVRGVELTETRKVDEKSGEETVGWSYKSRDPYGKSRRKRRRRASNLADDLTREGIEAYFEQKQRELEVPQQDAPAPEVLPTCPRRQNRQNSLLRISLSTCTTSTGRTCRRWRPTSRRLTSTAHARRASPSWTSATRGSWRRATTRTSSWRSCARTWTPQGASSMPPRRHATPCSTRVRGFWPACTCSPRRGATPRTPCPA